MSFFEYPHGHFSNLADMNYAIAQAADAEGWDVTTVPAISQLYTPFTEWPVPFVPIVAFGISQTGGSSGQLLTPPDYPTYTPPVGYDRQDMSSPVDALLYIPGFMGGLDGFTMVPAQAADLGVAGYYVSWYNSDSDGGVNKFYKVTRPSRVIWEALWFIGASLGIQSTQPSYGGYILKSPPVNGVSVTVWLDDGDDISTVSLETKTDFYVTAAILDKHKHPRSPEGKPINSSDVLQLMRQEQAFTLYINSQNLWALADENLFGQPNWYAVNLLPVPNVVNSVILIGEQVPCGPRYMTEAPVWWFIFNNTNYIRPLRILNAQVGRLISSGIDSRPVRWNGPITECLETFLFIRDNDLNTYFLGGLFKDILVGHEAYSTSHAINFDGDNFQILSNGTAAGILVRN